MGIKVLLRTVEDSDWESTGLVYKYNLKAVIGEKLKHYLGFWFSCEGELDLRREPGLRTSGSRRSLSGLRIFVWRRSFCLRRIRRRRRRARRI